jgi:GWxTD domain-containing protein
MATTASSSRMTAGISVPISKSVAWPALLVFLCGLALWLPVTGSAQMPPGQLTVYANPVVYNNPMYDSLSLVEFPFVFNRAELEFFRPDSADTSLYGRVFAQVILINDMNLPLDSSSTYFSIRVATKQEAAIPDFRLFNKLVLKAKPGLYTAHLTVIDVVSKRSKDIFFGSFPVSPPAKDRLTLSNPVLAFRIQRVSDSAVEGNSRMVRNGYLILNNPIGVFGRKDSSAFVYSEVYGLKTGPKADPSFRVRYQLLDSSEAVARDYGFRTTTKPGSSAAISDVLDLAGLSAGRYNLRMAVSDSTAAEADTARVPLIIFEPPTPAGSGLAGNPGDPWNQLTLQEKINCTHWLLAPDQLSILNRLSDVGKANFLDQFWRENNVTTGNRILGGDPSIAGTRTETVKRFQYANQWFSRDMRKVDGWTTDRGRVYMIYGPWDSKTEVPEPRTGDPFVIWRYNSLKEGKVFVFQDTRGDADYRLVHSNVNGEIYNSDWASRLQDEMLDVQ